MGLQTLLKIFKPKKVNIYKIEQRLVSGYDTYDSAIVVAENEGQARIIHPSEFVTHISNNKWMGTYTKGGEYENDDPNNWVSYKDIDNIDVTLIGTTELFDKPELILASFNAG